jgi:hypothetical protein
MLYLFWYRGLAARNKQVSEVRAVLTEQTTDVPIGKGEREDGELVTAPPPVSEPLFDRLKLETLLKSNRAPRENKTYERKSKA